jgi:hypothetical protein
VDKATTHPLRAQPFPIQRGEPVTWEQAEWGYRCYAALYGTSQTLERLAERHGFGDLEMLSCVMEVIRSANSRPASIRTMRINVRDLPKGERPPEVSEWLAKRVEAILDGGT